MSVYSSGIDWVRPVGPDGSDQGQVIPRRTVWISPDPRAGYVETHIRLDYCNHGSVIRNLELRWLDADLNPRTQWWPVTSWDYGYNVDPKVFVDVLGNALVLLWFNPPMSMPCNGSDTHGFWVSETGSVSSFAPVTPTYRSPLCGGPQFTSFGSALALGDGGFAFYMRPNTPSGDFSAISPSGWYARYPSGSGASSPPPAWLLDRDVPLKLLSGDRAYLDTRRDSVTCARTAEILGPEGQVCATLALDGSDGCSAADQISFDGTLVLHELGSCSLRWWPGLGRSR
jgi:hypothetical protein